MIGSLLLSSLFILQGALAQNDEKESSPIISSTIGVLISIVVLLVILIGFHVVIRQSRSPQHPPNNQRERGENSPSAVYDVFTSNSPTSRVHRTESAAYEEASCDTVIDLDEYMQSWRLASSGEEIYQLPAPDVEEEQPHRQRFVSDVEEEESHRQQCVS